MNQIERSTAAAPEISVELVKEIKLPAAVLACDASPDGRRVFAACLDGQVLEVDPETGEVEPIGRHQSYASGVTWLPHTQLLISGGYDGVLQWHDPDGPRQLRQQQAHRFWSWRIASSRDEQLVASVTGQYLAGGYKYEPAPEQEPSIRLFDAGTSELIHSFSHVPPVLSTAFSPDNRFLAAGNMMGEVRVWDVQSGDLAAQWTSPDFTSWGIIKSHHYIGGIFGMTFSPSGEELLVCGMGPMTDPMAGNGKQTWQRFAWQEDPPRKTGEIADSERGNGLMETLVFHPEGRSFLMAGRLAQGKWNTALFEADSGKLIHSLDSKMRVTSAQFCKGGTQLYLGGAVGQENKKAGAYPEFGRLKVYQCTVIR